MQEKIEKIMKRIHVFFSNCDYEEDNPNRIIMPRMPMLNLLEELNAAVYGLLEQCEVTKTGREREINRHKKKMDTVTEEAENDVEDIYAASMIYADRILNELRDVIGQAGKNIREEYEYLSDKLNEQEEIVKNNQNEIRDYLGQAKQGDKYKNIIREYNDRAMELRKKEEMDLLTEGKKDKEQEYIDDDKPIKKTASVADDKPIKKAASVVNDKPIKKTASVVDDKPIKKVASVVDISAATEEGEDTLKRVSYEIKVNPAYFPSTGEFSTESLDAEYEQWKEKDEAGVVEETAGNKKSGKKKGFSKRKKKR